MTLMVSCTSSRTSLTYFEDLKGEQSGTLSSADYDIKVIPDDELFIVVSSLVPEATAEFNLPTVNPAVRGNVGTPSQQSQITYLVDKAGDINFPGLGTLHVGGLTTAQIASIIAKKVSETVEDPYVKVQLVNFKVNVLGEVARPGTIEVDTERYSPSPQPQRCRHPVVALLLPTAERRHLRGAQQNTPRQLQVQPEQLLQAIRSQRCSQRRIRRRLTLHRPLHQVTKHLHVTYRSNMYMAFYVRFHFHASGHKTYQIR